MILDAMAFIVMELLTCEKLINQNMTLFLQWIWIFMNSDTDANHKRITDISTNFSLLDWHHKSYKDNENI